MSNDRIRWQPAEDVLAGDSVGRWQTGPIDPACGSGSAVLKGIWRTPATVALGLRLMDVERRLDEIEQRLNKAEEAS